MTGRLLTQRRGAGGFAPGRVRLTAASNIQPAPQMLSYQFRFAKIHLYFSHFLSFASYLPSFIDMIGYPAVLSPLQLNIGRGEKTSRGSVDPGDNLRQCSFDIRISHLRGRALSSPTQGLCQRQALCKFKSSLESSSRSSK